MSIMSLKEFRIPTILGLGIILVGIVAGVLLVMKDKTFITKASPDLAPRDINLTNIEDESVTISWQTSAPATGFVKYGQAQSDEQTILDERDSKLPGNYSTHHVTIKNLLPKTTYKYKIISGKATSEVLHFTTASPIASQNGFRPIVGSILDDDQPLKEGIVYLSIDGAVSASSLVKNNGNFLIPMTFIRNSDLTDVFNLTDETTAKLTVMSPKGTATALFKVNSAGENLPSLKLGDNLDLTDVVINMATPAPAPDDLSKFDLNDDGQINSADNAVILNNFGKNPKDKKADLNKDGVVDQKDLELLSKHINQ